MKKEKSSSGVTITVDEAFRFMGLRKGASPAEIDKRYRLMLVKCPIHPDKGGAVETFGMFNRCRGEAMSYADAEPCPACGGSRFANVTKNKFQPWRFDRV